MRYSALKIYLSLVLALALCSCGGNAADMALSLSVDPANVYRSDVSSFAKVRCAGSWALSSPDSWVSFMPSSGEGDRLNAVISFEANKSGDDRQATIVLSSGNSSVSATLTQYSYLNDESKDEEEGGTSVPGQSVSYGYRSEGAPAGVKWMEFPATDSSTDFLTYNFSYKGKTLRNYSFSWNQKALVADWVAYPLSSDYEDNDVGRSDDSWAYDPILGSEYSPAPFGGYCGNYDRGHLVPSEDRQTTQQANKHTFFGTNMTPQYPGFNQQIWAALESQVRSWAAKSDTLYVVTGCVTSPSLGTSPDSDRKAVTVPSAFYKVLLRYSKNSSKGFSDYLGAAFYLEHKSSYSDKSVGAKYSMSIDELENKLGMDFFVNLPDKIGEEAAAKVEAQKPSEAGWWF